MVSLCMAQDASTAAEQCAEVAELLTRKVTKSDGIPDDLVNKILSDHARATERFRIQKDDQRRRIDEKLEAKRNLNRLRHPADGDAKESDNDTQGGASDSRDTDNDIEHLSDVSINV